MPIFPIPVTLVRWSNRDAASSLDKFVFGPRQVGRRPPRGLNPEFVSYWIRENIKPDCSPLVMMRVVDVLRFYERKDVLDHTSRFLNRNEGDERSFRRAMYVLQAIGEVGTLEQCNFAVRYFNEYLLPQPVAMEFFTLVLETAETLYLAVDFTAVGRRLQAAIDAAGKAPDLEGSGGLPWRKYSDYNRNEYPNSSRIVEAKRLLIRAQPDQQLPELMFIYMGESPFSSPSMEIWAGRLIREYASKSEETQSVVLATFAQIVNGALNSKVPKAQKDFMIHRAAQAILYLQGELSFPQEAAYDAIENGPENFLWDDPGTPA
jgi:hypothetical protein